MFYPAFLDLRGRPCLVVGGGPIARRKALSLVRAGAKVFVVAPEISAGFGRCTLIRRRFRPSDVKGMALAIGATDDPGAQRKLWEVCRRRNVPVNVVDVPELCTFIVPSVFRRGPLAIAISTGGGSPALSKAIRLELERLYPAGLAKWVSRLKRDRARQTTPDRIAAAKRALARFR